MLQVKRLKCQLTSWYWSYLFQMVLGKKSRLTSICLLVNKTSPDLLLTTNNRLIGTTEGPLFILFNLLKSLKTWFVLQNLFTNVKGCRDVKLEFLLFAVCLRKNNMLLLWKTNSPFYFISAVQSSDPPWSGLLRSNRDRRSASKRPRRLPWSGHTAPARKLSFVSLPWRSPRCWVLRSSQAARLASLYRDSGTEARPRRSYTPRARRRTSRPLITRN